MSASDVQLGEMTPSHQGNGKSAIQPRTRPDGGYGAGDPAAASRPMAGDVCPLDSAPPEKSLSLPSEEETLLLDFGSRLGWALMTAGNIIASGTELLASDEELQQQRDEEKDRTADLRFRRTLVFLKAKVAGGATRIVFEDVLFGVSRAQTQLWPSLRVSAWVVGIDSKVSVHCVAVATLKRFATGNGGALKPDMARALALAEPGRYQLEPQTGLLWRDGKAMDDNEVDAIWLARYTAAVDRGEVSFVGPHQRKAAAKAQLRVKRAAAKAEKKARSQAQKLEDRTKRHMLIESIKAAGRCCGVLRKPMPFGRAVCPKCGSAIRIPKLIAPTSTPAAPPSA